MVQSACLNVKDIFKLEIPQSNVHINPRIFYCFCDSKAEIKSEFKKKGLHFVQNSNCDFCSCSLSLDNPTSFRSLPFVMAAHVNNRLQLNLSFLTRLIVTTVGGLPVCRCVSGKKGPLGLTENSAGYSKTPLIQSDTLNSLIFFQLHLCMKPLRYCL